MCNIYSIFAFLTLSEAEQSEEQLYQEISKVGVHDTLALLYVMTVSLVSLIGVAS